MTTRLKASTYATRQEFESAVDRIATLQVALRILEGKRDKDIQRARDAHAEQIESTTAELKSLVVLAEKYAGEHRSELLPDKRKSGESTLAVFGFRLGNPTLKTLNKRWTWDGVLEAVRTKFKGRFIRTKEELDKDALKAQLDDEQLAGVGCRISQSDDFFVEAKEQPAETVA